METEIKLSLSETRENVYIWLNIYKNMARNEKIHEKLLDVHKQYIIAGGERDISYFEKTLDNFLFNGYCGY